MSAQQKLITIKSLAVPGGAKAQRAVVLAGWLRWLGLAALVVTLVLLGDWRPLYLLLTFPPRLLGLSAVPPTLLEHTERHLQLYPSDLGALAVTLFGLLSWLVGGRAGAATDEQASGFTLRVLAPLGWLAGVVVLSATQALSPLLSLKIALHLVILLGFMLALRNLRPPAWVIVAPLVLLLAAQGALALWQAQAQSSLIGQVLFHWDFEATADQPGASVIQLADGSRWLRAYGTFPHPNILGGFLCLALPVVAGAALQWRRRRATWLLWGAVGLGLVALILSFSRGAWLGVLGALAWSWLAQKWAAKHAGQLKSRLKAFSHQTRLRGFPTRTVAKWAVFALLGASLVGGLVVALEPMLQSRLLLDAAPLEQRSVDERVILLETSAILLWQHPLLGVGAGNMPLAELSYPPASDIAQPVHNVPLAIAVETGLAGMLLWLIPPVSIVWSVWRERKKDGASHWALIGSAALVAVLIAAQFDHYFWSLPTGRLMYWLTIGLSACWSEEHLVKGA